MIRRWGMAVLVLFAGAACVTADPPKTAPQPCWHGWWHHSAACPPIGCCPDDYVRKPFPLLTPIPCGGGPNDYCRKPFPSILPVKYCGSPNDYGRKLFPCLLCPPPSLYLQCVPYATSGCNAKP